MRRNATKVAAAVLTLAVTMTSVNIPTTAAAATKKVKLNKTKKTLTVGKTLKLTLKEGNKKVKATKVKFTSSKKAIATVTKYGNVKAKKKGKATITATYKKKKYKCKITVKKKATTNPTTAPTNAPTTAPTNAPTTAPTNAPEPTTAPTDAPTTAPTDAPSTAPTDAPATVGTIKEFKAVGAKKLQVEFEAAVPEASKASLTFKRGNSVVPGKVESWDAENKVATFVSDSILPQGKYTVSITGADGAAVTKEADVEAEKVNSVEIKDQPVLTGTSSASKDEGRSNDEAYIYYDVKNQYGESIRERTTINWSITSCDAKRDNKRLGLVVAHRKNDKEIFTYGTKLHVTGVCIKDGTTVTGTKELTVGTIQAIDKVDYIGFVKRSAQGRKLEAKDILKDVPADFPKGTYALLYQAYDQNGDLLEPAKDNLASETEGAKLTFVSAEPTYVMNDFSDGEIYTDGVTEYSSVTVEPGMYIDKGTSVKLMAMSTRTGNKNEKDFTIGATKRLKSFKIETPAEVVADGDVAGLPFTATDMDGNVITDYKTIARSSNVLSFTASEGTLRLTEGNAGEAVLTWEDAEKYRYKLDANGNRELNPDGTLASFNPYWDGNNNGIIINDNVDRTISLTAVVTGDGATSNTTTLAVSDMRRPASIVDVRFGFDGIDTVIAGRSNESVNIANDIVYTDQYGKELTGDVLGWRPSSFWAAAEKSNIRGYNYSIRVKKLSGAHPIFGDLTATSTGGSSTGGTTSDKADDSAGNHFGGTTSTTSSPTANADVIDLSQNGLIINHNAKYAETDKSGKFDTSKLIEKVAQATVRYSIVESEKTGNSRYNDIGKARTETYTIVPISDVSDFQIKTVKNKLGIKTYYSQYPNASYSQDIGGVDQAINSMGAAISSSAVIGGVTYDLNITTTGKNTDVGAPWDFKQANDVKVESKYKGLTLSVPFMYVRSTDDGPWGKTGVNNQRNIVSGSSLAIAADSGSQNNDYISTISNIKEGHIKWQDLYNVNTARYERKDTNLKLQFFIGASPDKYYNVDGTLGTTETASKDGKYYYNEGAVVDKYITISDENPEPRKIVLADRTERPKMACINNGSILADVYDQYGQLNYDRKVLYTVTGYTEDLINGRLEDNYTISNNGYDTSKITGAERGDSYTLTANVANSGITAKAKITVGGDNAAYIESNRGMAQSDEYALRTNWLGYNR